ncbi:IS3 family transposase [Lactobacillus helveticus]|uniref:IS3 family transposase n=3 Tax=Lactobacillus helveticus TaxID=1587 RepID=UPI001EDA344A|nr:IS3 family transposase [Lactobacillus helveticus]
MSKFNKEQKIEIYRKWKDEKISISQLSKAYKMNLANLDYMLRLIDMHGTNILNTRKRVYSKKFKEQTIEQTIFGTKSDVQLSLELGFKSIGMLNNWLREYKENGYNVIIKQKGRPAPVVKESQKSRKELEKEIQKLKEENLRLRIVNEYVKKTEGLGSGKRSEEIAKAITDLRHEFKVSLDYVLEAIAEHPELPIIARSSYYKIIKRKPKKPKRPKLIAKIKEIFNHHQGLYGYRRAALQLIKEGWNITEKTVRYWMHKLGLKGIRRNKRKYSSYKGTIGKIAPNLIHRDFFAPMPNMKWHTDITEFHLNGEKLYLSPILDGCGGDIVSYSISRHPDMDLVMTMLDKAFVKETALNNCTFHTDQGCQYQSPQYQRALKLQGITQSMSRKGNSMDDGLMENFFGLLKTEMFYDQEYKYHSLQELTQAIKEYIEYYNEERIKSRLKGLTPKEYRNQASINPVF